MSEARHTNTVLWIKRFSSLSCGNWYYSWHCATWDTLSSNPFMWTLFLHICAEWYLAKYMVRWFSPDIWRFLSVNLFFSVLCPEQLVLATSDSQIHILNSGSLLGFSWIPYLSAMAWKLCFQLAGTITEFNSIIFLLSLITVLGWLMFNLLKKCSFTYFVHFGAASVKSIYLVLVTPSWTKAESSSLLKFSVSFWLISLSPQQSVLNLYRWKSHSKTQNFTMWC